MAAPSVGDTVDIDGGEGRRGTGIVEQVVVGTVRVHMPGPPEITIVVAAIQLSETGPNRWRLHLW